MMTKAPRERQHKAQSNQDHEAACPQVATVASLGVQTRLVSADPEREHEVACLIARYERVCREWARLTQRALDLLGPELEADRFRDRPSARKRHE